MTLEPRQKRRLKQMVQYSLVKAISQAQDEFCEEQDVPNNDEVWFLNLLYANEEITTALSRFDDIFNE